MKKLVIILFLIAASAPSVFGQFSFSAGILTGGNFNIQNGKALPELAFGLGLIAGVHAEAVFADEFGVVLQYSFYDNRYAELNATYYNASNVLVDAHNKYYLTYSTFDLLLKYKIGKSKLYLIAGPSFSSNKDHYFKASTTKNNTTVDKEESFTDMISRVELKAGMGLDINLGKSFLLSPYLVFAYGFNGISHVYENDWKFSSVQFGVSLGYKFF